VKIEGSISFSKWVGLDLRGKKSIAWERIVFAQGRRAQGGRIWGVASYVSLREETAACAMKGPESRSERKGTVDYLGGRSTGPWSS